MKLICFDLETTSADYKTCGAVQVAAYRVGADTTEMLVDEITRPCEPCSAEAIRVHGILPSRWENANTDYSVLKALYSVLLESKDDMVLAGHNITTFDLPILWRLAGEPPINIRVIDTLICALRCYPHLRSHKLSSHEGVPGLITALGLGKEAAAHTAAGDALMVGRLVDHFCRGLAKSEEALADWCLQPRVWAVCPWGKYKGVPWGIAEIS